MADKCQQIKCNVTECHFNKNVYCDAPVIQVDRNGAGRASQSVQTKCETFRPRA